MARPVIDEEVDVDLLEKLSRLDAQGLRPSRIEQIATQLEKLVLQREGFSFAESAEIMGGLLSKINISMRVIDEDNIKDNTIKIAKLVKKELVDYGVKSCLEEQEGDDLIGDGTVITFLAFRDEENELDFADFHRRLYAGEIGLNGMQIAGYMDELVGVLQNMQNNNQNVR